MKILWATPWNVDSAIGRVSALAVNTLKRWEVDVTVVRTEDLLLVPAKPLPAPPLARRPFQLDALESYDVTVVHFGDHWPFHARAMDFLQTTPCVAVLHDATMLNYFLGKAHLGSGPEAVQSLCDEGLRIYGPVPNAKEAPTSAHHEWAKLASEHWPFLHEIASKAEALVVHSHHCLNLLPESSRDKARVLMLPAAPVPHIHPPRPSLQDGPLQLCTIGHMNENKRVASVIRALASSAKLKHSAIYTLVGPITEDQQKPLEALALELGFQGLRILGRVTDKELSNALNAADVICCLRYPTLEGASASVLEALQYARPTLVTNAGFYRQLPDELVWKIDPDNEVSDILKQLEDICDHYPKALEKAAPGPAWVHANCQADQYAQQILDLCLDLLPTKATTQGRRQLEARAASLGGQMTRSLLNGRIALASDSLFHHSSLLTNNAERDLRP